MGQRAAPPRADDQHVIGPGRDADQQVAGIASLHIRFEDDVVGNAAKRSSTALRRRCQAASRQIPRRYGDG